MVKLQAVRRIWFEASMPIFIDKILFPLLVLLIVFLVVTNPMQFDWTQRITGAGALLFFAFFLAHTLNKYGLDQQQASSKPAEQPRHRLGTPRDGCQGD